MANRDRGSLSGPAPPTPPCVRVRTRRFGGLCGWRVARKGSNGASGQDIELAAVQEPPARVDFVVGAAAGSTHALAWEFWGGNVMRVGVCALLGLLLVGCASSSSDITAAYVSPVLYRITVPTARDGSASCIDESRASFRRSGFQTHKRSDRDRRCGCVTLASCLLGQQRWPDCRGSGPVKRPNGCHRAGQYPEKMRHSVRSGSGSSPLAFPHMKRRSTQSRSWVLFLFTPRGLPIKRPGRLLFCGIDPRHDRPYIWLRGFPLCPYRSLCLFSSLAILGYLSFLVPGSAVPPTGCIHDG